MSSDEINGMKSKEGSRLDAEMLKCNLCIPKHAQSICLSRKLFFPMSLIWCGDLQLWNIHISLKHGTEQKTMGKLILGFTCRDIIKEEWIKSNEFKGWVKGTGKKIGNAI